ncbi:hypothetical protein M0811_03423 [Anaeramoeba ignava]|uniref:Uncharacterized protein n=1 Tax=Anaeramoeba ignava TaxID=1746090 RepID=A0A9Q0L650_ANAIG|nr:hypothetical protein M0811_03423 [Anaeramoeba ignava]
MEEKQEEQKENELNETETPTTNPFKKAFTNTIPFFGKEFPAWSFMIALLILTSLFGLKGLIIFLVFYFIGKCFGRPPHFPPPPSDSNNKTSCSRIRTLDDYPHYGG